MTAQVWTEKYCPKKYSDFIGNSEAVSKIKKWFADFFENKNTRKILLLHGPPGIGKTALAYLALNAANYNPLEFNCNNITDIKEMKDIVRKSMGHANILDMFCGNIKSSGIILDEVDNITNGITELVTMLKTADEVNAPVICTANNLSGRGLKPLRACAEEIRLNKPSKFDMEQLIKHVCKCEKMNLELDAYYLIINSSQFDWRMLLHILQELHSIYKDTDEPIGIDEVNKVIGYMKHKDVDLQLNDIINRILNKPMKFEEANLLFISDCQTVPLLVYENYHQVLFANNTTICDNNKNNKDNKNKLMLEKFCNISNNMVEYDVTSTSIYENQDMRLLNYVGLYSTNMTNYDLTHDKKSGGEYYSIGFSTLFNKISQHRRNIKAINNLPLTLETNLSYEDLYILSEVFIYNIFNKMGKLDYVIKIMDQLDISMIDEKGFTINPINTILSINSNKTKKITTKIKNNLKKIYTTLHPDDVIISKKSNSAHPEVDIDPESESEHESETDECVDPE